MTDEQSHGTFGPDLLNALNLIGQQMQNLEAERARLLVAYSDGRELGAGSFNWNSASGAWTFTAQVMPEKTEP